MDEIRRPKGNRGEPKAESLKFKADAGGGPRRPSPTTASSPRSFRPSPLGVSPSHFDRGAQGTDEKSQTSQSQRQDFSVASLHRNDTQHPKPSTQNPAPNPQNQSSSSDTVDILGPVLRVWSVLRLAAGRLASAPLRLWRWLPSRLAGLTARFFGPLSRRHPGLDPGSRIDQANVSQIRSRIESGMTNRLFRAAVGFVGLFALSIGLFQILKSPEGVEAAWWDESWGYRMPITFTNSGAEVTNQKVKFDIDTATLIAAGQLQADCDDIRFQSVDGTLPDYFLDSAGGACDTASTDYWVLLPRIPAGSNVVYLYYGNPSAMSGGVATQFAQSTFSPGAGPSMGSAQRSPGPVAYWPLDEGQGQTANDGSGQGNAGQLGATAGAEASDPTWQTEDMCVVGKCLKFDGTDDQVSTGDINALDGLVSLTVEAWVKPSEVKDYQQVIGKLTSNNSNGWSMQTYGSAYSRRVLLAARNGGGNFGYTTDDFNINEWQHWAMVYDGSQSGDSNRLKFYLNGVQKTLLFFQTTPASIASNSESVLFGNASGTFFNGFIDEPKIYNYARTAEQIKQDYLVGSSASGSGVVFGQEDTGYLNDGLVGYWKMDESATPSIDSSGNANSATWNGNTAATAGKFGNGKTFDGTDDYMVATDSASLDVTSASFAGWIKPTVNGGRIIDKSSVGGSDGYLIDTYMSNVRICTNNCFGSNATIATGVWTHFVVTIVGSSTKIYINGALDRSTEIINAPATNALNLRFGIDQNGGSDYNGAMDEIRIYNRALSPGEVQKLYNWAPGPVGYWKMDEGSGTSAYDTSGNNIVLATTGTTSITLGKYGKARNITETNYLSSNTTAMPAGASPRTFSAWIKPTVVSGYQLFFSYGAQAIRQSVYVGIESGGFMVGAYATYCTPSSDLTATANNWYHVSYVYDGTTWNIYVNGVKSDFSCTFAANTVNNGAWIGGADTNGFNGLVDDVRIYNYARTQAQVLEDMNAGQASASSTAGDSIAHWAWEEGQGQTASDSSGEGNSGTLGITAGAEASDPAWQTDDQCKSGNCVEFDGVDDMIVTADSVSLSATSAITVEGWVNMSDGFSPASDHPYGIVDKGAYQFYLDSRDGKVHWVLNDAAADAMAAIGNGFNGLVETLAVYNGNLIAAGEFTGPGSGGTCTNCYRIAAWNGSAWSSVGNGFNGAVRSLAVYDGNLIAAGMFTGPGSGGTCTDCNRIASWNGSAWSTLGNGLNGQVFGLANYNGDLIVGGDFTGPGSGGTCTDCNRIAAWNGSNWSSIGYGFNGFVRTLAVYKGNLIAAGWYTGPGAGGSCSNCNYIASWNGSSWSPLSFGLNAVVLGLAVYDGNLIAGGQFTGPGAGGTCTDCFRIASWNGSAWSALDKGLDGYVHALNVYNGDLIVSGYFTGPSFGGTCTDCNRIASWNGSAWSTVGNGFNLGAHTLANYNGNLIVGGLFTGPGSGGTCTDCNNIARWGTASTKSIAGTTSSFTANSWYHLSGTYDGAEMKIYVNGELENTVATTISIEDTDHSLYIGAMHGSGHIGSGSNGANASGEFFKGMIDELKIYNYAISSEQVLRGYTGGGPAAVMGYVSTESDGVTPSNDAEREYCVPGDTTACTPPVAEWKFDEGNGTTTVSDTSGNGYDGTMNGSMTQSDWVPGKYGKALDFDGSDDYIGYGDATVLDGKTATSFGAWIKPRTYGPGTAATDVRMIIAKGDAGGASTGTIYMFFQGNGAGGNNYSCAIDYGTGTGQVDISAQTYIPLDQWSYVMCAWGSGNKISTYVDGRLIDQSAATHTGTLSNEVVELRVGGSTYGSEDYFDGLIDNVRIYDYARTPAQIAWEYNRGKPIAHWRLDDCQGSTAYDISGGDNHGIINIGGGGTQSAVGTCETAGTAWGNGADGKFEYALNFDGTDDYVSVADNAVLDIGGMFSISVWLKTAAYPAGIAKIVGKWNETGNQRAYVLGMNSTNYVGYVDYAGSWGPGAGITSNVTPSTNAWEHVVYLYDGSNIRMYVNGVEAATPVAYANSVYSGSANLIVGGSGGEPMAGGNYYIDGQIDDVRIYNYALTPAQVLTVMQDDGAVRFGD